MIERQITVTEASRNFADLVNRTYYQGQSTLLIRSGEAVARMIPIGGVSILGSDLVAKWETMAHLDSSDAEDFTKELEDSRKSLEMPKSAWD